MSQNDLGAFPGSTRGNELSPLMRNWRDALHSSHSGTSRPTYLREGMLWLDIATATAWVLKLWTGTIDVPVATMNPTTGAMTVFSKTEADARFARLDGGNAGPLGGFRNKLVNPNGDVNRRAYASGTATVAANQYTIDRWRVVVLGETLSWTVVAGVRTFTAPTGGVEQVIEGVNLAPGTYTLSWSGTATARVDGAAVANGGEVAVAGGSNVTVRMVGGSFRDVQFEQGNEKTAVERRPLRVEQFLCERYFRTLRSLFNADVVGGGAYSDMRIFPEMRVAPTVANISYGNAGNGNFYGRSAQNVGADFVIFVAQPVGTTSGGGWNDLWSLSAEL